MKILFYDGNINRFSRPTSFTHYNIVNAGAGYTNNVQELESYQKLWGDNTIVLTNSIVALDHDFGWNQEEEHTEIYFYIESERDFIRCDRLTSREIREGHNIMKMFMNNEFEIEEHAAGKE